MFQLGVSSCVEVDAARFSSRIGTEFGFNGFTIVPEKTDVTVASERGMDSAETLKSGARENV